MLRTRCDSACSCTSGATDGNTQPLGGFFIHGSSQCRSLGDPLEKCRGDFLPVGYFPERFARKLTRLQELSFLTIRAMWLIVCNSCFNLSPCRNAHAISIALAVFAYPRSKFCLTPSPGQTTYRSTISPVDGIEHSSSIAIIYCRQI